MNFKQMVQKIIFRLLVSSLFYACVIYFTRNQTDMVSLKSQRAGLLIGLVIFSFAVIYDYDIWSLKRKLLVHTGCMALTIFPILIYSGWFESSLKGYLLALVSFIGFGVLFASIGYLISRLMDHFK
ncbi:DUF3021 family protein [Hutsoniella sourekii]